MNIAYQISVGENVAARLTELALLLSKAGFIEPYAQVIRARNSLLDILDADDGLSLDEKVPLKSVAMVQLFPGLEDLFRQNGACEVEGPADQDARRVCSVFPRS